MEVPKPPHDDPNTKKPLDPTLSFYENSKYFQLRALLKDLRPNFLQVLQTPDFRNCEAATEIQEKMKVFMDLYKEMAAETFTLEKCKSEATTVDGAPKPTELPDGGLRRSKSPPVFVAPATGKDIQWSDTQRTYIVGGSAFGWNYITFLGNAAVYYGRTKEAFRAANIASQPPPN